jgi:DnaJ-class molecular chaperone
MYKELNLKEGAGPEEIKADYRKLAKSCHPDSNGEGAKADSGKFMRAHEAYKGLLKEVTDALGCEKAGGASDFRATEGTSYVFIGENRAGLDVYYDILLERPAANADVRLNLPWTRPEACPRCLGQGVTLSREGNGFVYKPRRCERCGGKGATEEKTRLRVTLTPEILGRGKVRLRNAGGYSPKNAQRGDLVIRFEFVEKLPRDH